MSSSSLPAARPRVMVILGMHRSGTSLLSNLLAALGVPFGERLIAPRSDNERGFFEHAGIVAAHEEILVRLDRGWPGGKVSLPYPEGWWRRDDILPARRRIRAMIAEELAAAGGALWGIKDPRLCRMMPLWHELATELGVTLVPVLGLRHPAGVTASLARRDDMSPAQARLLWLQHTLEPFAGLSVMPPAAVFDSLVEQPEDEARRLAALLGLPWDEAAAGRARAAVAPELRHHRSRPDEPLPPPLDEVWRLVSSTPAGAPLPEALRHHAAALRDGQVLFAPWAETLDRLSDPHLVRRPLDQALLRDEERARWRREAAAGPHRPPPPMVADMPCPTADHGRRNICIVTADIIGPVRNGGIGTAYAALAEALAADGHAVTVLYVLGGYCENGSLDHWIAHWAARGVCFEPLPPPPPLLGGSADEALSLAIHHWLSARYFAIVHGHEWRGLLYHTLMARRTGLSHGETLFIIGTHSPVRWHALGNGDPIGTDQIAADHMERACVALADHVVSPSRYLIEWMSRQGWRFAPSVLVRPNLLPAAAAHAAAADTTPRPVEEIVFFGRLERRKGLYLFLEALALLAARGTAVPPVSFLGKHSSSAGEQSRDLLAERRVIDDRDAHGALEYLAGGRRLAVMPSLLENSPYTVLECLAAGVPFLAAEVGGIAELIHPEDVERVLFAPSAAALADRLARTLRDGMIPARPAFSPEDNRAAWCAWHRSLTPPPSPPPPRLEELDAPLVETAAIGCDLYRLAAGSPAAFLLLRDPAAEDAVPDAERRLADAMVRANADVLSCLTGTPQGTQAMLTGAAGCAATGNRLRPAAMIVRRLALLEALDDGSGWVWPDSLLAARGFRAVTLPEGLFRLPLPLPLPARPAAAALPTELRAFADWIPPPPPSPPPPPPPADPTAEMLAALLASRTWRMTAPLRRLIGRDRPRRHPSEVYGSVWWDLAAPLRLLSRLFQR